MGDLLKNLAVWTIIAVIIMSLFSGIGVRNSSINEFNYTEFNGLVEKGQVSEVTISGREIEGRLTSGESFKTELTETTSSGADVPSAIIVTAIRWGEILNLLAVIIDPSTSLSPPKKRPINPIKPIK